MEADENSGHWISIVYGQNNDELHGFIHASRLKAISLSDDIPLVEAGEHNWCFIREKDQAFLVNIRIRVEIDFEMSCPDTLKAELELDKDGNFRLNNEDVWGLSDPEVKTMKYKTIRVDINGKNMNVPVKQLETLFSVGYDLSDDKQPPIEITYDQDNDTVYIRSLNGDASYSYDLLFIFENGRFKKKLVYIPF